ncbi:MAG: TonB family protein [Candidatus Omnitrophota bacterium]
MKKNISLSILVFLSILISPASNYATDGFSSDSGEELKLYVGYSKIIPVKNPTRVEVSNPDIADVVNVTNDELTISPKAAGRTALRFWDIFGEQNYQVKVFSENIGEIKQRIDSLLSNLQLPDIYTQAQEDEGRVLLLGSVRNPQEREKIALVLDSLKDKTVDLIAVKEDQSVVEIAVEVLELSKDAETTLGFTNPLSSTISLTEVGSPGLTGGGGTYWTKLFHVLNMERGAFNWTLSALVKEGKARILSRPRLACQSGKEAELLVGGEKPIFTTNVASAGGEGTSVDYKEYGLKLKIKPIAAENNRIKVILNVDISELSNVAETIGTTSTGATTASAYPLTRRSVVTELYLNNGQTLAIGGLIKHKQEEDLEKTPWLGDIPIIGALFRKKTKKTGGGTGEKGDTELFITLTPTIIASLESAAQPVKQEPVKQEVFANTNIVPLGRSNADKSAELKNYTAGIQRKIMSQLSYPVNARKAGYQGTVKLGLLLSSQGRLKESMVKDSSGYKDLDDTALEVAKLVIPYPPFPPSFDQEEIWVEVPISYQLN